MRDGKILAIDYGTKKIGLAVTDDARLLAFGRGVIDRSKGFPKLVLVLKELCLKEHVTQFVFGLAINDDDEGGKEGESAGRVRNFAKKLGLHFPDVKITFIDESFSSFQAQQMLRETGRHAQDDELAATIILQRYLDKL